VEITSIERDRKKKDRLSVYIDGKFSFTISEEDYISLNLYEKTEISQETIDYIKNKLNFNKAKSIAVRYLSMKLRTEKEVRMRLQDEGFERECIDAVIDELKALGYINPRLYAQKYVFDRSKLKPMSKRLMKLELLHREIPEDIIDEVLEDWNVEDHVVAENLLKRKFGKYDLTDEKIKRKAYMFLLHRGFSNDTVRKALKEFCGQADLKDTV